MPWTSTPVERLMCKVSKRYQDLWMDWTATGLEVILNPGLVKYVSD